MARKILKWLLLIVLLIPLWLWIAWLVQAETRLQMIILDKTVLNDDAIEHKSVNWLLDHGKYVRADGNLARVNVDYSGFFPLDDEQFEVHDLHDFSDAMLDSLSFANDAVYVADTYGIYANEWYHGKNVSERSSLVYGGMTANEAKLLARMKKKGKLVLMEFNSIASPTGDKVRGQVEDLFHFHWTGWTGRYFARLDTARNPELPRWVVRLYLQQHQQRWPFSKDGIVFVHSSERIEILETGRHLSRPLPQIHVRPSARHRFGLPDSLEYPYWLDIISTADSNQTLASYAIYTTETGDSILRGAGIPDQFPAVIEHLAGYRFYYFAGDFADNPISLWLSHLRWIERFRFFMHDHNTLDRRSFFWEFYQPLVQKILSEYTQGKSRPQHIR